MDMQSREFFDRESAGRIGMVPDPISRFHESFFNLFHRSGGSAKTVQQDHTLTIGFLKGFHEKRTNIQLPNRFLVLTKKWRGEFMPC
jgi:hypothetical protein